MFGTGVLATIPNTRTGRIVTIDLTGGLSDELEYVFASSRTIRRCGESVNAWIWDDGVEFGLPRIGIEAVADQWDTHDVQVNMAFADGRVFTIFAPRADPRPVGADGRPRVLGAGPLSFELVEPYGLLRMRVQGEARRPARSTPRSTARSPARAIPCRSSSRSTSARPCRRG